jgi:hypothetical protein
MDTKDLDGLTEEQKEIIIKMYLDELEAHDL